MSIYSNSSQLLSFLRSPVQSLAEFISIFKLSLPLLISAFSAQAALLINSILTGHFSEIDLAAVSYGFIMTMTIASISQGAIRALLPILQQAHQENNTLMYTACLYSSCIYLVCSIGIFLLFYWQSYHLEASELYQQTIRAYLLPMLVFLLALQLLAFCVNTLIIFEKIKIMALFGLCATCTDLLFSAIFVHGFLFLPALGAQGAALGSMVGSLVVLSLAVMYINNQCRPALSKAKMTHALVTEVFKLIKLTLPAGLNALLAYCLIFIVTLLLTQTKQVELNTAANQILMVLSTLLLVFINVSSGIVIKRVNQYRHPIQFLLQIIIGYQLFYWTLLILILFNFSVIVSLFGVHESVILTVNSIQYFLFFYILFASIDVMLTSFFISQKYNQLNFRLQLITVLCFLVGVLILFAFEQISLQSLWLLLMIEKLLLVLIKTGLIVKHPTLLKQKAVEQLNSTI